MSIKVVVNCDMPDCPSQLAIPEGAGINSFILANNWLGFVQANKFYCECCTTPIIQRLADNSDDVELE